MPLFFWMPLIVLSGLLSVAQNDADVRWRAVARPRQQR